MTRFALVVLLALGACSAPPAEDAREEAAGPVAGPAQVLPGDIAKLQVLDSQAGQVLADREHYTLYLNTQDGTNPPKPTCVEPECTLVWPPLLAAGGKFEAPGVDPSLLGTVKRPDGLEQVTVGGHPVHRYVDDEAAGDITGHGVDDRWFAVGPNGAPVSK
ncbi:hypothetical protein [Lentzea sp. NPDC059081]|uniref:COG4315 family predicted lipoprotein n=1 Tax=Lentzea sp. NPDC059081 TaxID=3346719 RepID=UPI0036CE4318